MRKTLTTAALLLALSCPALAGEIHTPGAPAPPPTNTAQEPTADGDIQNEVAGALTQVALTVLASILP